MRIRFRQGRRDAERRRGEHHRAGHEAAAAEHDIRSAFAKDPAAGARRDPRQDERAGELDRRPAWEAADPEGVELVARFRNEPRFDAIRRPGERHVHASLRQRLRDRDRRQHVSCRPPGCDQAPKLLLYCHDERC